MSSTQALQTAIQKHGAVQSEPAEVYGEGNVLFRIGNGGAGATGLLRELCQDYLSTLPTPASITWVKNHSRNTQLALLYNYIDLALTYEREQEALAEAEGWSSTQGCAFHDHFCLVGPWSDPAGIHAARSPHEALGMIAQKRCLFHSRRENSATMWKEEALWSFCDLSPWKDRRESDWFKPSQLAPAEALVKADEAGAYLLTDRSTLLRQATLGTVRNSIVFFEPTSPHHLLMNSCYALTSSDDSGSGASEAKKFVRYLQSQRGQNVVAAYLSRDGRPLFATLKERYATTSLKKTSRPDVSIHSPQANLSLL